jgi:signal transduction histidine kinase
VLAGSGCYSRFAGAGDAPSLEPQIRALIGEAFKRRCHEFRGERTVIYVRTGSGREVVVLLESPRSLSDTDRALVEVFCSRLSIAFDNVLLHQQLQEANARLEERVLQRTAELTAANDRLEVQWRRLREANRFKGEILGTVAHDLKNPLGVIMGRAEMLTDLLGLQPPALDGARAQIDHIRDSAKAADRMVDALIADAMSDALDISIRLKPIDLVALVDRVSSRTGRSRSARIRSLEMRKPRRSSRPATPIAFRKPWTTSVERRQVRPGR